MDLFNKKKVAKLEKEIEELKNQLLKYKSITNIENEVDKRKKEIKFLTDRK